MNLVNDEYKYILNIHRKSGCSSLKNLFIELHHHDKNYSHHNNKLHYIHNNDVLTNKKYKKYYKFSVIRNAYERVVSMYFNIWLDIPDFNHILPERKNHVEEIKKRGADKDDSFNEFIHMLINNKIYNNHFEPQTPHYNIDRYIDLKNLEAEIIDIYQHIGVDTSKVKSILSEKYEYIPKNPISIKLDDYDFKSDYLNLDIINNGIPTANSMITENNAKLIKKKYLTEIQFHNMTYNHLI